MTLQHSPKSRTDSAEIVTHLHSRNYPSCCFSQELQNSLNLPSPTCFCLIDTKQQHYRKGPDIDSRQCYSKIRFVYTEAQVFLSSLNQRKKNLYTETNILTLRERVVMIHILILKSSHK